MALITSKAVSIALCVAAGKMESTFLESTGKWGGMGCGMDKGWFLAWLSDFFAGNPRKVMELASGN